MAYIKKQVILTNQDQTQTNTVDVWVLEEHLESFQNSWYNPVIIQPLLNIAEAVGWITYTDPNI